MAKVFANSEEPDQAPRSAASDLGLHCLPVTLLRVSRIQWVKGKYCDVAHLLYCSEEYKHKSSHEGTLILRAPGEIVAARFQQDNQWYRARVLQTTEEKVKVRQSPKYNRHRFKERKCVLVICWVVL